MWRLPNFLRLHDTLLSAVFGGLLNAISIALCLYADATAGGRILSPFLLRNIWSNTPQLTAAIKGHDNESINRYKKPSNF
jgi:uncharacterized membrane-anchored protein YitT (DUF2179 family)